MATGRGTGTGLGRRAAVALALSLFVVMSTLVAPARAADVPVVDASAAPAAVSWGGGRLDVFIRGGDAALWHKWWSGAAWSGWERLGGVLTSAPAVASWGPGRLDVFARGTDGALWHKWWSGAAWSGWERLGGVLVDGPAVASWGAGRLDVFALGTDGALWHKWWSGAWSGWERLGGGLTSPPAAASSAPGTLDVFARGTDGALWRLRWAGAWTAWVSVGGMLTSAPSVTSPGRGRLDVFARGTDGALWHRSATPAWGGWERLGGVLVSAPAAASSGGRLDVFVRGSDDCIWHMSSGATWSNWESLARDWLDPYPAGAVGYDISWPQCGSAYPDAPYQVAVVGVGGKQTFSHNPCLASEAAWFRPTPVSLYVKLSSPAMGQVQQGATGPAGTCAPADTLCWSVNYGWNLVYDAFSYAAAQGVSSSTWWLDVEQPDGVAAALWTPDTAANAQVVAAAIAALISLGVQPGVYSNSDLWPRIVGSYTPDVPMWQSRRNPHNSSAESAHYCQDATFTAGPVWLVQYGNTPFDLDLAC